MNKLTFSLATALLLLFCVHSVNAEAGSVTITSFKFTHQRLEDGARIATINVIGPETNLTGNYNTTLAPRICQPCQRGDSLFVGRIIDLADAYGFSGEINGVSYKEVHLQGMLEFNPTTEAVQVPASWSKRVRFSVPVRLSGPITAYRQRTDFDHPERAIFQTNIANLQGGVTVILYWYLSTSFRQTFEDTFLSYSFAQ